MGRRGYPPEFRRRVLDLIEAGRKIADVARDLGVSQQTIYTWRRQDRIDRGIEPGTTTADNEALAAANKRIRELETELEIARRAVELLKETPDPKGASRRSK
jgi:transposase